MNVKELYDQTAQLGFETSLEDNERFIQAANRALLQVNTTRPAVANRIINHAPLENLIDFPEDVPVRKDSDDICFEATGARAFYFESDITAEKGNVIISILNDEGNYEKVLELSNTNKLGNGGMNVYKGIIPNATAQTHVRIEFTGDYAYSVNNLALYGTLLSANEEDIPAWGKYSRYNFRDAADNFSAFCCPPIRDGDEHRFMTKDYRIEGRNTILFPRSAPGIYTVWYERKPTAIKSISENEIVDLDEDLAQLMPLLIASYVWLDDEPSKASYYLSLYREQEMRIKAEEKRLNPIIIKNINGW